MIDMDPVLADAFEKHVARELVNAVTYLRAYSVLRAKGWEGFSKRWKNEAFDEFGHAQNFTKYLARRGVAWEAVPIEPEASTDEEPVGLAKLAYMLEGETEQSMRGLVQTATTAKDDSAVEYVSGKLVEQEKMTKKAWDFAERLQSASEEPGALVILDRQLENKEW
jgi:ferritin